MTSKYAKYLLPILLILLFANTASALPTVAHDTVRGEMYVSSTANWPSKDTTNNFNVPNGTVVFARYYIGVWSATPNPLTFISTTFNGHASPTNPSYYSTEMGVTWVPYDVTDYLRPGEINTATINSKSWGDGRQYGSTLVVVLKNESKPQMEYWVADGLDWMHYAEYIGYEVRNSTTYFNGTVDLSDVQSASLYSTHLTGFNYEDLNGNSLPSAAESVSGDYFNYIRWDDVQGLLAPENQTILVSLGSDSYCSVGLHALSITYNNKPDLIPVNITPSFATASIKNTMTVTIENQGNKDSSVFNISLLVDDKSVDTQPLASLGSGDKTTVNLNWTPDGSKDAYLLTVVADPENAIVELNETNNKITKLVGITSVNAPIAEFSADKTSGDSPLTVNFTDQSTNFPTSWAWDFDNDGTVDSNMQNPVYTYNTIGIYTVKLTVTNAGGNESETKAGYIVVNPLAANFTAIPISGDTPLTVNFTDQSTGTPTAWAWDFENDGTVDSTQQNPTHTYSTPGTYTVSLTVTNAGGTNSTVKTDYITASSDTPVASFSADKNYGTSPLSVTFIDQSTNAPTEWLWDFGDGTNSTSQNPTHAYTTIGTYTVKLAATNVAGTSIITKIGYITVLAGVSPVWTRNTSWDIPDIGSAAAPCFVDLNGDGDYDLLIGTGGGITYSYENIGTKNSPVWTKKLEWDVLDVGSGAKVASADIDDDGDYDLLIGEYRGAIYSYENTGTKSSPTWTRNTSWDVPSVSALVISPCFADFDDDGDLDLLIGRYDGITYGYENIGTKNSPVWTEKSWNSPSVGTNAAPCSADLDGDGDYDLLIGVRDGISYAYENIGTTSSPIWKAKSAWNTPDVGGSVKPSIADLDDDGDYDLLIGENGGASYAYENTAVSVGKPDLIPTAVNIPSSVIVNTPYTISATINNNGTVNVGACVSTLAVDGVVVDTQGVSGLESGSNASVNFSWTPEAAGDYNLIVTADPDNGIAESDEANNALTITVTASAASETSDTTKPVIDSVVLFPANTTAGATISISANITDDKEVTKVTAGDIKLNNTDGIWKGSITAPAFVGNYSLSINATDAAGNVVETSVPYRVVQLSGGANIAVSPRSSSVVAGNNTTLNLKVKNTQNIDDAFKVRLSVSELPASYQADLSWFNWTEKVVTLKSGEEVLVPVEIAVPNGTVIGRKLFRANVNSQTSTITGFDTGYLTIS